MDKLSPEASPKTLHKNGVKYVNNLPLFIVIATLTLFVLTIAMIAVKRTEKQHLTEFKPKLSQNTDTSNMAAEVISGRSLSPKPAVKIQPMTELALPVAVLENPDHPPLPGERPGEILAPLQVRSTYPELAALQQEKIQEFIQAVKAKTGLDLPKMPISSTNNPGSEAEKLAALNYQRLQTSDPGLLYQRHLEQIREARFGVERQNVSGAENKNLASRWSLDSRVEVPNSPYEIRAGGLIPGIMLSGIKSELPSQIIAQVSQHVYDTATGKYLLIPQGSRLIGIYSNKIAYGQKGILIAWQRLIFPDGKALDLGSMPGADSAGYAGFRDQVDNHYARIFSSALLMSGISAGITYSQNQQNQGPYAQPSAGSVMSAALGQQLGQVSANLIEKNLSIAPSLTIRPGYRFNVIAVKDLTFNKPYQAFDYKD